LVGFPVAEMSLLIQALLVLIKTND
jgi:hypothetical protein